MTAGSAPWHAQFTTAQLAVIVEEAARVDKPVAAHVHGIEGIRRAVEAGVTTLEHCSLVTETNERRFDEPLAARIAARKIFVCPTINVNAPYVVRLTGINVGQHVKAMHEMGVRIIAGTDAGVDDTPHHQYVGGLEFLASLGFRPAVSSPATATTCPDSGRFDVSTPGTPFASPDHSPGLRLTTAATRRRQA
jgi:imidazolonepropionase-like amidohydrolase